MNVALLQRLQAFKQQLIHGQGRGLAKLLHERWWLQGWKPYSPSSPNWSSQEESSDDAFTPDDDDDANDDDDVKDEDDEPPHKRLRKEESRSVSEDFP